MADDVEESIEVALNRLLKVTEIGKNLHQDLKQDILLSVSEL